ncbi:hypothetical protein H5410_040510 [Solanum commersonii]|uniref:Uncharacterized protein n=1 Tax=Solanum commersonii TaxID=4109 RepID=A0A9J5XRM2_SOLCO|nr:hypothetical protein H5410_040510 [Solanum commersonii]
MVDAVVQASLADTPMADPSRAGTIDVTLGTNPQIQSDTPGIWIEEQSMDTNGQKGTRQLKERRKEGIVPSPEGENQVGDRKKQSVSCRTVPQCSVGSPKVTELEDVEGQSKKEMKLTKGRITELINDPDLLVVVAIATIPSCFKLARERDFETKITELMVYGYWVVMGSARESES